MKEVEEAAALTHAQWLALVREEPLEPLLPIVDPHHHLFPSGMPPFLLSDKKWKSTMFGPRTCLDKPYLPQELVADIACNNVTHTIHVECGQFYDADSPQHLKCVGETRRLQQIADGAEMCMLPRICAGIVAHGDLSMGTAVGEQLDAHMTAGKNVRGVRDQVANAGDDEMVHNSSKDPQKLSDPKFREGLAELGKRRLIYDCFLYHLQLPQFAELAAAFPEVTMVCNHAGMPIGISTFGPLTWEGKTAAQWRADITTLAKQPNVVMKLGGLTMSVCGFGFGDRPLPPSSEEVAAIVGPFYQFVIDAFGAERCMFESNFPMDKGSCSYTVLWNAFKRIAKGRGCTREEMTELFGGTAKRVYRLE